MTIQCRCSNALVFTLFLPLIRGTPANAQCNEFTYDPFRYIAVGNSPTGLVLVDMDGDGTKDQLQVNPTENRVSMLRQSGAVPPFQFLNPQFFGVGTNPSDLAVADFNADGSPDAAVTNQGDNTISVLVGGAGTLTPRATIDSGGAGPVAIVGADFDLDGLSDLAVSHAGGPVTLLRNVGGATFAPAAIIASGFQPAGLTSGDFNTDGLPDLAFTSRGDNSLRVLLNTTLPAPATITFNALAPVAVSDPVQIAAADLTGDGLADLALASPATNAVRVFRNPGAGHMIPHALVTFDGRSPRNFTLGDLNGDGLSDLAVLAANLITGDRVYAVMNEGSGLFTGPRRFIVGATGNDLAIGDVDVHFTLVNAPDIVVNRGLSFNLGNNYFIVNQGWLFPGPEPTLSAIFAYNQQFDPITITANAKGHGFAFLGAELQFQWRKNGVPISYFENNTAELRTLVIQPLYDDAGMYDCVVTGPSCQVTTPAVPLSVFDGSLGPVGFFGGNIDVQGFPPPVISNPGASTYSRVAGGGQTGGGLSDSELTMVGAASTLTIRLRGTAPSHTASSGYTGSRTFDAVPLFLPRPYTYAVTNQSTAELDNGFGSHPIEFNPVQVFTEGGTTRVAQSMTGRLERGLYELRTAVLAGNVVDLASTPFALFYDLSSAGPLSEVRNSVADWTMVLTPAPCLGDFNLDGFVDDTDFVTFAAAYEAFTAPTGDPSDFNADGFVDDADFVIFAAAYEQFVCP